MVSLEELAESVEKLTTQVDHMGKMIKIIEADIIKLQNPDLEKTRSLLDSLTFTFKIEDIPLDFEERLDKNSELDSTLKERLVSYASRVMQGNIFFRGENFEAAIHHYDEAVAVNLNSEDAWVNKGAALACIAREKEAIACFDMALRINPRCTSAYFNRAVLNSNHGDWEDAIVDYIEALNSRPHDEDTLYNLGYIYHKQENFDEAIACYDELIENHLNVEEAWFYKGNIHSAREEWEKALQAFVHVMKSNPYDLETHNNAAITLEKLGETDHDLLAPLVDLAESNDAIALALARIQMKLKDQKKGKEWLDAALKLNPMLKETISADEDFAGIPLTTES